MILIRDLNKYYRSSKLEFHALKNININIEKGEFVSIVGKSGSGKSTLLNVIGLLKKKTTFGLDLLLFFSVLVLYGIIFLHL